MMNYIFMTERYHFAKMQIFQSIETQIYHILTASFVSSYFCYVKAKTFSGFEYDDNK